MLKFNVNNIGGKWIVGDNTTTPKNGIFDSTALEPILNIPSVINGKNIDEIGYYAFVRCDILEEVIIGDGIKQINKRSFNECPNLKSFVIPPSIEFIGEMGIHTYNSSEHDKNSSCTIECTGLGTLVITILPNSKLSFVGDHGISRKEKMIIYFFGRRSPMFNSDPFGIKSIKEMKIYAPYTKRFLGMKTIHVQFTQCQRKRSNNNVFHILFVSILSI